ncbi:hypothetical protein [Salinisphaera sp. G21_0]|uniref:hypothetical protein n=1 Tax=Salinisphaera sp. G21_0 TaxID=2821094 RepID=UPI001ADC1567|nr:hypothetical protein [Salinisphaera sp. G21_0]MBO9484028.1 hypothetical protein [Salinisphaera sp. G21_0]
MSNTIKLKSSATPGKVPLASDLASGEVAINTADGLIYALVNGVVAPLNPQSSPMSSIEGLEDLVANLQARIDALEHGTVYQEDEGTDMKLISSSTKHNATEFEFDGLLDHTKYSCFMLVLQNIYIDSSEFIQKHIGIGVQSLGAGDSYWDGYGSLRTSVIAYDGTSTPMVKDYSGIKLIDEEFSSLHMTGQINIVPPINGGLGSIQAHLETANGPYRSAFLSCEWSGQMTGLKIFSSVSDVIDGTVHLYGLMK